jgi:hypothetical protein
MMLTLAHVGRRTSSRRNTGVAHSRSTMSWLSGKGSAANSLDPDLKQLKNERDTPSQGGGRLRVNR